MATGRESEDSWRREANGGTVAGKARGVIGMRLSVVRQLDVQRTYTPCGSL